QRPLVPGYNGKRYSFIISKELTSNLRNLAETLPTTLFVTIFTGFAILLSRYTQQEDIAIGSPSASRHYPNVENILGYFINLLVLRSNLSNNPNTLTLMKRHHTMLSEAFANQDIPFEKIVEAIHPSREATINPLCSTLFVFQNYAHQPITFEGLSTHRVFS